MYLQSWLDFLLQHITIIVETEELLKKLVRALLLILTVVCQVLH